MHDFKLHLIYRTIFRLLVVIMPLLSLTQCRFNLVDQPSAALPGETIVVNLRVGVDLAPEPNPHKGVLCLLLPDDWEVLSADYSSSVGNGTMVLSPDWADSAQACHPAGDYGDNMQWVGMISDTGYTYETSFEIQITVNMKAGLAEGCYNLGYLVTKATPDLICSGNSSWAPVTYPHPISISSSGRTCDTLKIERSENWDNLLHRKSGWTGADGIYTIPLSGDETPDGNPEERTLILFSDTFIGEVDQTDKRTQTVMVNNTYAVLDGKSPVDENIKFFWATDAGGKPATTFIPATPQSNPGDWYWLMDGIVIDDSIHVFGLRLKSTNTGLGFEVIGTALLSFRLNENDSIAEYRQVDAPIYYRDAGAGWEIVFGQAIMPMTNVSGNPDADGYIYIYGPKNSSGPKELVAARVLPENFSDFSAWRYWNGSGWDSDIKNCSAITSGISQEFSLSPVGDGKYMLVFQTGSSVAIRKGESPTGPFGFVQNIYSCPEVLEDPDIFVYNAKAHPHLSEKGNLLISYNVNTYDFWDHFSNAGIYRPRFINLEIPADPSVIKSIENIIPERLSLAQNYPNPFNPTTTIVYDVHEPLHVSLVIYNTLGQAIKTLVNTLQFAGQYSVEWDGTDHYGAQVSSGIYLYKLEVGGKTASRKMVLIK